MSNNTKNTKNTILFMKQKLMILMVCALPFLAQARTITGVVTDQTGETVISASVVVKGTTIGTVTDFDGNYSIDVPDDAKVLIFSFIASRSSSSSTVLPAVSMARSRVASV